MQLKLPALIYFCIQDKRLLTPPLTDGVLPGITRSRLLQLAKQQGVSCMEVSITKAMLKEADGLFINEFIAGYSFRIFSR